MEIADDCYQHESFPAPLITFNDSRRFFRQFVLLCAACLFIALLMLTYGV